MKQKRLFGVLLSILMLLQLSVSSVYAEPATERYSLEWSNDEIVFVGVSDFENIAYTLTDIDGSATELNAIGNYIWQAPLNSGLRVNKVSILESIFYGYSSRGWKIWVNGRHYMIGDKYIVATEDEGLHLADEDNGFWFDYDGIVSYRQSLTDSTNATEEMTVILEFNENNPKFKAIEKNLLYSLYVGVPYLKLLEGAIVCNHPNMVHHAEVPATCTLPGISEYWSCPDCEKIYEDELGTQAVYEFEMLKTVPHGAMDKDNDGLCDNCGKNMPLFEKVTSKSEIVPNNRYILVANYGDAKYAMSIPTITDSNSFYTETLPAKRIYSNADGTIDFMEAYNKNVMINEFKYIYNMSSWYDGGMRYGFHFTYKGKQWLLSYNFQLSHELYAKYGYHIVDDNGSIKIADAYQESWTAEDSYLRMLSTTDGFKFAMNNYDANTEYTVSIYKLVEGGTYGKTKYRLRDAKSIADYDVMEDKNDAAVNVSSVLGISNALSQDGINGILANFVDGTTEKLDLNASAKIRLVESTEEEMSFDIKPVAYLGDSIENSIEIDDVCFKGNPMTINLYTNGFYPELIAHTKTDGTTDYYYPEHSQKANRFSFEYDCDGNSFVQFDVTEFSAITLYAFDITAPMYNLSVYYTDESGIYYSDVPLDSPFVINFELYTNAAKEPEPCVLYVAFYDNAGRLIKVEKCEYDGYNVPIIEASAIGEEVGKVKAFAWNENMNPLSNLYDSDDYK